MLFDDLSSIDDLLRIGFTLRGRLSTINLSAAYVIRENRQDDSETESLLMGASFSRSFLRDINWSVDYQYREQLPDASDVSLFENRLSFNINFDL